MKLFSYLLEANLYLIAFYGFFLLALRKETFFRFNRWYLLGSSLLSFVIPLIKFEAFRTLAIGGGAENVMIRLSEVVINSSEKAEHFSLFVWLKDASVSQYLFIVYLGGGAFILIRVLLNLWKLNQLIRQSSVIKHEDYKEVHLKDDNEAFSFMNYLFIGPSTSESIYKHELAHIRQKHSVDKLLIEFITAICWFNPIVYLYKIALKTVHELLADEEACRETNKYEYAELMVNNVFRISENQLIHTFNTPHTLKTRLTMLQKNKSSNWALLKYGLTLPLAALLIFISSCMENKESEIEKTKVPAQTKENTSTKTTESTKSDNDTFYHVDENPEYPGGFEKIGKFIGTNLRFPSEARSKGIQGRVTVAFVVEKDGSVSNIELKKGIGHGCDEEAMRVVKAMPKWKPGKQDGKAVRVHFALPIMFRID